jgi:hypothetical protein
MRSLNGQIEWLLREAVRRRTGKGVSPAPAPEAPPAPPAAGEGTPGP